MNIKDRDVKNALEVLQAEFENAEENIIFKDTQIEQLEKLIGELENDLESRAEEIEMLEEKVEKLEEALAEAYLTGVKDVGD